MIQTNQLLELRNLLKTISEQPTISNEEIDNIFVLSRSKIKENFIDHGLHTLFINKINQIERNHNEENHFFHKEKISELLILMDSILKSCHRNVFYYHLFTAPTFSL